MRFVYSIGINPDRSQWSQKATDFISRGFIKRRLQYCIHKKSWTICRRLAAVSRWIFHYDFAPEFIACSPDGWLHPARLITFRRLDNAITPHRHSFQHASLAISHSAHQALPLALRVVANMFSCCDSRHRSLFIYLSMNHSYQELHRSKISCVLFGSLASGNIFTV